MKNDYYKAYDKRYRQTYENNSLWEISERTKEVIDTYTVYSMETAKEMSKNISWFANSDYGVGITGMLNCSDPANPSKDPNKVYISIYDKENDTYYNDSVEVFSNDRIENKSDVIKKVMEMLISVLS